MSGAGSVQGGGRPFGSARGGGKKDVPSAFSAMACREADSAPRRAPTRTIVFHGDADSTVHPSNGVAIVRQALEGGPAQSLQTEADSVAGSRSYRLSTTCDGAGMEAVEHWVIEGLGHAWSGGQPAGSL